MKLRPVSFDYKEDYIADQPRQEGFIAEEVEKIDPLLVRYMDGQIESVKYDRMVALLTSAIQDQQEIVKKQGSQIDGLKQIICVDYSEADFCKEPTNNYLLELKY